MRDPPRALHSVEIRQSALDLLQLGSLLFAERGHPVGDRSTPGRRVLHDRVPVPERPGVAAAPGFEHAVERKAAGAAEEAHVAGVRGHSVIGIDAVLAQQLPVRPNAVALGACSDLHARLGLVHDQIQVLAGVREVLLQTLDRRIEADEDEAPVALRTRRPPKPEGGALKGGAVGLLPWHPDELALVAVGPAVIEALEALLVSAGLTTDLRAAMPARVQEDPHLSVRSPHKNQRARPEIPGLEVTRLGDLGLVPHVDPRAVEQTLALQFQDLGIREGPSVDAKDAAVAIVDDIGLAPDSHRPLPAPL